MNEHFHYDITLLWKPQTKRSILETMNSLFDPFGFVSLVIVEAKLIYRLTCEEKLEWGELLPNVVL